MPESGDCFLGAVGSSQRSSSAPAPPVALGKLLLSASFELAAGGRRQNNSSGQGGGAPALPTPSSRQPLTSFLRRHGPRKSYLPRPPLRADTPIRSIMAQVPVQTLYRDPQLFYWILIPISVVMVLTGVLRHYASVLMAPVPKKLDAKALREQRALARGVTLRANHHVLSRRAFEARREALTAGFESGEFLKDPDSKGKPPGNPLSDPGAMDGMMGMMKNNMAMIIPNTLIMSWINAFFSGYVIMKLPFPITIKFKSMLQAGVQTKDMDPRWMSSISWYFLCIFGLQFVYVFLLGSDNAASQLAQQMQAQQMPMNPMGGPGVDIDKQFKAEAENLQVVEHYSVLDEVEDRLLARF